MSEMKNTPNQNSQESEIAIKFGKGLAQPFTGKDGTQYMRIQIPRINHPGSPSLCRQKPFMKTITEKGCG